jgi:hypothetical protein
MGFENKVLQKTVDLERNEVQERRKLLTDIHDSHYSRALF